MAAMLVVGGFLLQRVNMGPPSSDLRRTHIARDNMTVLRAALERFETDCGRYPTPAEGLVALIHDPAASGWRGPYIFELKPDPWARAFRYSAAGATNMVIGSAGTDGLPDTDDDIIVTDQTPPEDAGGVYRAYLTTNHPPAAQNAYPPDSDAARSMEEAP